MAAYGSESGRSADALHLAGFDPMRSFGTAEISLDDYLATQGVTRRLDLLKIDVQGFEAKVRGARRAVTERKTKTYISSPAI